MGSDGFRVPGFMFLQFFPAAAGFAEHFAELQIEGVSDTEFFGSAGRSRPIGGVLD